MLFLHIHAVTGRSPWVTMNCLHLASRGCKFDEDEGGNMKIEMGFNMLLKSLYSYVA